MNSKKLQYLRYILTPLTLIVILQLFGIVHLPAGIGTATYAIEGIIIATELGLYIYAMRLLLQEQRKNGRRGIEAWLYAEVDELSLSGLPKPVSRLLYKLADYETRFWRYLSKPFRRQKQG